MLHTWAPYSAVSDSLKHAVVVAEDIDFFSHRGFAVDELRIACDSPSRKAASFEALRPSPSSWRRTSGCLRLGELAGCAWSDGVPEAVDATGEAFGFDRLEECLSEGGGPEQVHDRILSTLGDFVRTEPHHDDVSLVAISWNGDSMDRVSS